MIRMPLVLACVAGTFISWGVYGVLLHHGQAAMNHSSLRPFVGVGIAYFLIAVLIPGLILNGTNEKGYWSVRGTALSLAAGAVGAIGALGIILALNFGGSPVYVMPFVFGCAPVVNTLVTAAINRSFENIKFLFIVGLFLVIVGAVGVLINKQTKLPTETTPTSAVGMIGPEAQPSSQLTLTPVLLQAASDTSGGEGELNAIPHEMSEVQKGEDAEPQWMAIIGSMILAAFCWGAYGPVLHIGQSKMGGSRLRPFCCVGLAYFVIAVAMPLALITSGMDATGTWDTTGLLWSIAAGAAGAIGALGIIYAFNFGGKPIFVMPLVFGFAPIVNTVVSMGEAGTLGSIRPMFVFSLALTIAGAVMVLVFQPRPTPAGKKPSQPGPDGDRRQEESGSLDRPPQAKTAVASEGDARSARPVDRSPDSPPSTVDPVTTTVVDPHVGDQK